MTPQERLLKAYGTSSEVARQANVTRQCVNNWWNRGRIGADHVAVLAKKLGVSTTVMSKEWVPVPGPRSVKRKSNKRRVK